MANSSPMNPRRSIQQRKGYRRWGFDQEIIFKALDDSIGKKESTKWLKNYYKETDEHET